MSGRQRLCIAYFSKFAIVIENHPVKQGEQNDGNDYLRGESDSEDGNDSSSSSSKFSLSTTRSEEDSYSDEEDGDKRPNSSSIDREQRRSGRHQSRGPSYGYGGHLLSIHNPLRPCN